MNDYVATADLYLKYDHTRKNLIIYVSKLLLNVNCSLIEKASLVFTLLPKKISLSTAKKIKHRNSLYFVFEESLIFGRLDAAKIGTMGLTVELISHQSLIKQFKIANNYQPLDYLDLTSVVSRNILRLTNEQLDYMNEHEKQTSRLLNRQTSNISSGSVCSPDPRIAVTFKFHSTMSRLDVYIQRLTNINLFVANGYVKVAFFAFGNKMISSEISEKIKFLNDNLLHVSFSLETKDACMRESGVCIQIIPSKKKDLQVQSIKFSSGNSVLYVIFSVDKFTSITSKLAWLNFCNSEVDFSNRWHIFLVGQATM